MLKISFYIQDSEFETSIPIHQNEKVNILISSSPRPYEIKFVQNYSNFSWILDEIKSQKHPLIFSDKNVFSSTLKSISIEKLAPLYLFDATEENKNIDTVLDLCDFLKTNNATKGSTLYVIGGGITQDIGAFAGAMYRRGIPWIFIPTTFLAQTDSCLGGKSALNYAGTKNMLGLFSAPRKIVIDTNFTNTLHEREIFSGLGETLRLAVTGGLVSLNLLEDNISLAINRNLSILSYLAFIALSVKKAVVEADEFEFDIRRSMNYGHTLGHAIEVLSDYRIPHGSAIAIGIMIENKISANRMILSKEADERIFKLADAIVTDNQWEILSNLDYNKLLSLLKNDKKAIGSTLKLATISQIGKIIFIDIPLDMFGVSEINKAITDLLKMKYNPIIE